MSTPVDGPAPLDGRPRLMCVLGKSPLPDNTGSRRRLLRLVQAAGQAFEVRVVIAVGGVLPDEDVQGLDTFDVDHVVIRIPAGAGSRIGRGGGAGVLPQSWRRLDLDAVRRTLVEEVRRFDPDVVWMGGAILADAVAPHGRIGDGPIRPLAVDVAHIERQAIDSQLRSDVSSLWRHPRRARRVVLLAADRRARIAAERRAFESSDLLTACSAVEGTAAGRDAGGAVAVVPNGVDLPERTNWVHGSRRMLFVGNLGYPPNADAVRRLANEILPEVRRSHPDVRLQVVGPGSAAVAELASRPGVVIEGFVPDLADVYSTAELVVAPIFSGSGTKLKVLEALAHGVPVVTTSEGIAGLDLVPGEHVLIGASNDELVQHTRRLLEDGAAAGRLGAAGRKWVENGYGWPAIGAGFTAELLAVAGRGRST